MKKIDKVIQASFKGIIHKREKAIKASEARADDLLGILLESNLKEIQEHGNNKNVGMNLQDVIEECKTFYFAGQETTAALLVWTMIILVVEVETWWWWIGGGDEGMVRGKGEIVLVASGGVEGMASGSVDKNELWKESKWPHFSYHSSREFNGLQRKLDETDKNNNSIGKKKFSRKNDHEGSTSKPMLTTLQQGQGQGQSAHNQLKDL
nr:11-oxo-beta-amyrin 30-oxidase [Quercus suber]